MKKLTWVLIVGLLWAWVAWVPAQADPPDPYGSFVQVFQRQGQRHRVYFTVTAKHGAKQCTVTLNKRTVSVRLSQTSHVSGLTNMLFLRKIGATKAFVQAKAASSPTHRIACTH